MNHDTYIHMLYNILYISPLYIYIYIVCVYMHTCLYYSTWLQAQSIQPDCFTSDLELIQLLQHLPWICKMITKLHKTIGTASLSLSHCVLPTPAQLHYRHSWKFACFQTTGGLLTSVIWLGTSTEWSTTGFMSRRQNQLLMFGTQI
jgi:hypothetical protein